MADGSLYLRRGDKLIELAVEAFASEDVLQRLLAENPVLLASPSRSQHLVLIDREMGVPDAEDAGDRWSIDHVFVDGDAVPVIVEVKRATDTRRRREVVAQMLDYAANIGSYWPSGRLRSSLAARAERLGESGDALLCGALGVEDVDEFWEQVAANLEAGRMRLVFVADAIPDELLRIVEFLNARMSPTEVVAIELRQFLSGTDQVVNPRVLGESVAASDRKLLARARRPNWTLDHVRGAFARLPAAAAQASLEILDWLEQNALLSGGTAVSPSATFATGPKGGPGLNVSIFTTARADDDRLMDAFTVNFWAMTRNGATGAVVDLAAELRTIPGVSERLKGLEEAEFRKWPSIPIIGVLDAQGASTQFVEALARFDARTTPALDSAA